MVAEVAAAGTPWVAIGMGTLSLASSMLGESENNELMAQKARDFGIRSAGIDFSSSKRLDTLVSKSLEIVESTKLGKIAIDRNQSEAEANARVIAAAAGVAGDSVDSVIGSTEANAALAQGQLDRTKNAAERNLRLNFVDETMTADINKGTLDTSTSSSDQTLAHALSFTTGFARGFDFG